MYGTDYHIRWHRRKNYHRFRCLRSRVAVLDPILSPTLPVNTSGAEHCAPMPGPLLSVGHRLRFRACGAITAPDRHAHQRPCQGRTRQTSRPVISAAQGFMRVAEKTLSLSVSHKERACMCQHDGLRSIRLALVAWRSSHDPGRKIANRGGGGRKKPLARSSTSRVYHAPLPKNLHRNAQPIAWPNAANGFRFLARRGPSKF